MLFVTIIAVLAVIIYLKVLKPHKYWKEKGIRHIKPWPVFGFMAANIFRFKSVTKTVQDLYNTFPEQRYFGAYEFLKPNLFIRDPELIKQIMVKDFETFPQHRSMVDPELDPLWSKNLFAMKGGEQWKEMRSTLSPMFTSSKLRAMFVLMKECAQNFVDHHLEQKKDLIEIEMRDATTRFANDIITTTAFGISCDSVRNPDNKFFLAMKEITGFQFFKMLKFWMYIICPGLSKIYKSGFISDETRQFYSDTIKESIRIREQKGLIRPDMIHLLMEARKGKLSHDDVITTAEETNFAAVQENPQPSKARKIEITDEDITAQAILFFFAGFETVSIALSHLFYELALNLGIRDKLQVEIDGLDEKDLTYEALLKMKYLDMVVSETLRKWPPAILNDRVSVRPFTIEAERVWEKTVTFDAGTLFMFPVYGIHRDAKYYPEPDKFDPERFNDENKAQIKPFTYLPFGVGPKSCIGSRFALLELKTFIFYVLNKFEVVPIAKTKNPLVLSKTQFNPVSDDGFWIGLRRRNL